MAARAVQTKESGCACALAEVTVRTTLAEAASWVVLLTSHITTTPRTYGESGFSSTNGLGCILLSAAHLRKAGGYTYGQLVLGVKGVRV